MREEGGGRNRPRESGKADGERETEVHWVGGSGVSLERKKSRVRSEALDGWTSR